MILLLLFLFCVEGDTALINKKLELNEAIIWYLTHSGWAIKTKNNFLIFDYIEGKVDSNKFSIAYGYINPYEIKAQKVYVFVTHSHWDHYSQKIFKWKEIIKNIKYILGFEGPPSYIFLKDRDSTKVDELEIFSIKSTDEGVGFLVKVDGLTIFHSGDHAYWRDELEDAYKKEIDYLGEKFVEIDIAFLPIGRIKGIDDTVVKGAIYAINKLNPKMIFPMHCMNKFHFYKEFAEKAKEEKFTTEIYVPSKRGERFFYSR